MRPRNEAGLGPALYCTLSVAGWWVGWSWQKILNVPGREARNRIRSVWLGSTVLRIL